MRRAAALLCAAGLLCSAAGLSAQTLRAEETDQEREALDRVSDAIRLGDCERAAQALNAGLKARHPGVYLLAGSMYQDGVCLKASWERAERLYLQAAEAGHEGGRLRLVAGLAENKRDVGAALWWAQRARVTLPADCRVAGLAAEDADAFVFTLRRWAPERLDLCVYTAGVMAHLAADVDYPNVAASFGESGHVVAEFRPSGGVIDVRTVSREAMSGQYGLTSGDDAITAGSRQVNRSLEQHVRDVAAQALARFERPAGLPPELTLKIDFFFRVAMR